MKTIEKLEIASNIIDFASRRALELIYARGTKWIFHTTPDSVEFLSDGIDLGFREDTRYDCPYSEGAKLTIEDLDKTEVEWAEHIIEIKAKVEKEKTAQAKADENQNRKAKIKQFEKLKGELGL